MLYDKITELCNTLGISVPNADEHGHYYFPFEGGLELTCSQHKQGIMLSAPVIDLPENVQEAEDVCRKALHTSLGIMQKSPDVVALDKKTSKIVLYRRVKEERHQKTLFADAVEEFLNTLELVRNTVGKKEKAFSPPPMFGGGLQRF
ncbi:MAG: CesT family type III secretion system chaperone [Desulfovibrionales bacterium]|nr:CesT family type III secretion system chaperone [Desulfovibrionales bacterium]